jgi:hypothetical protein
MSYFFIILAVPLIAQRPADTHVSAGSNAVFECGVRGNPRPTIFWSLQDNDTVLFPEESWNEFHAEDTKDSVSTLVVHVSYNIDVPICDVGRCVSNSSPSLLSRLMFQTCLMFGAIFCIIIVFHSYAFITERQERTT